MKPTEIGVGAAASPWPALHAEAIGQMLAPEAALGGVAGLRRHLEAVGMGHLVDAWMHDGGARPMSTDTLAAVLPATVLATAARVAGLEPGVFCAVLAQRLPQALRLLVASGAATQGEWPDAAARLRVMTAG